MNIFAVFFPLRKCLKLSFARTFCGQNTFHSVILLIYLLLFQNFFYFLPTIARLFQCLCKKRKDKCWRWFNRNQSWSSKIKQCCAMLKRISADLVLGCGLEQEQGNGVMPSQFKAKRKFKVYLLKHRYLV